MIPRVKSKQRTEQDHAMETAFDAGWDSALEEAILIAETIEHEGGSAAKIVAAIRKYRVATTPQRKGRIFVRTISNYDPTH